MHGFIRFIKSSRLLTVGAIAFIITLAAALAAFLCDRLGVGVPRLPSGLHAVCAICGPVAAFSLAAADVRDDIRRLGRSIDGAGRSGEK